MADLCLIHPRLNPYYRDARIRRCLLNAGLINRYGDIVRGTKTTVAEETTTRSPRRRRKTRERSTKQLNKVESPRRQASNEISRPKSAHPSTGNLRAKSARRATTASKRRPSPPPIAKEFCHLTIRYLKPPSKVDYDLSWSRQKGDEIVIMQQHCGGENLTVYKGFVQPGGTFVFDSQRHKEYPFALAFYINGLIDSRISVCCEYRHKKNIPLGGPSGSFAIVKVEKGEACQSCTIRRQKRKSRLTRSSELELVTRFHRSVVTGTQQNRRSPSLSRPQSPTPPLEEEKRSKKRRSSKKKVQTRQSPTKESPILPKVEEKKTITPILAQKFNSNSSDKSRSSSAVLIRKAPSVTDDEQKQSPVEPKMNRSLSDDTSDNDTQISFGPKTPLSDSDEKRTSPEPIKAANEPTDDNYSPDFDELSGDEKAATNSRFNQSPPPASPPIENKKKLTEAYLSENHDDSDYPSKSTLKKTISTGSSDNPYDQESSEYFNAKKSHRIETDNTSNTIDTDKPTTHARQNSSDSSEDFLGIKRLSPTQNPTTPRNFEDDFFQNDNPTNQRSTSSWRDDTFFDQK